VTAADALYEELVAALVAAGRDSLYTADANEPAPRYRAYGVRAPARREIFRTHRTAIKALPIDERISLATRLINSGFGEQQDLAFMLLHPIVAQLESTDLPLIDAWLRRLHGWSKIDGYCSSVLQPLLVRFPQEIIALARLWNRDPDPWLRRASVVLFTRKVAKSGHFNDIALELGENLVRDEHEHVLKGVGWMLQDLMESDQPRITAYTKRLRAEGISSVVTLYAIRRLRGPVRDAVLAVKPTRSRR
jgi:3-methyladenine DNA glycosylase AlkD